MRIELTTQQDASNLALTLIGNLERFHYDYAASHTFDLPLTTRLDSIKEAFEDDHEYPLEPLNR